MSMMQCIDIIIFYVIIDGFIAEKHTVVVNRKRPFTFNQTVINDLKRE
jgi:hypothetical protein